jgi:holliday junction resolvase Hjr
MDRKAKGSHAERELVAALWKAGWAAIRTAGSGSSRYPAPDVLAGNGVRRIAVECKAAGDDKKYLAKEQVAQLQVFAKAFGAEPWIGIRFDNDQWYFISLDDLKETPAGFVVSTQYAKDKGLVLNEVIGHF